ncbi:hypothetical protein SLEP1_g60156 [Rubroshorea leprosula]|uniref:Uncharacterized protein n=1 Tax=Rubroshorea leprosula TaxID=152421 RepID=A0AAV5L7H0_9ROSI|nr:hypothetical protein SLEP1_g41679 [Rubroshorea leprosula]GKV53639.1 hypothetical protein SLEP1_g60156 [Rubroshorea leprosula]
MLKLQVSNMNYGMNVRCIVAVEFFSKYAVSSSPCHPWLVG